MERPDISIIMPSFNSESTIEKAIESIENQRTLFTYELIIVDDGSTDNTVDLIKQLMKQYDNMSLFLQTHKFQAAARNMGIAKSKGRYIMFSDDDDQYLPGFIEKMGNEIQSNSLVMSGIKKVFTNGRVEEENETKLERINDKSKLIGAFLTQNKEMDVGLWNKIFKKEIIVENGIKMSNENFFEDSLFVLQYLMAITPSEIQYLNKPYYLLMKRKNSTTLSFDSTLWNKCETYISKVKELTQKNLEIEKYLPSFEARISLFFVHRRILTDPKWNAGKQKDFLQKQLSFKSFKYLTLKYKVALAMACELPKEYISLFYDRNTK